MWEGTPLHSLTKVFTGIATFAIDKTVNHIRNFRVSKQEMKKAKHMCQDRKFAPVNLDHLLKRSKWLFDKMRHLCDVKYKHVFAKHQFQLPKIKNFEFQINLKKDSIGEQIFVPQYQLNADKRLCVIYNTLKYQENGMYIPDDTSIHNVPILL